MFLIAHLRGKQRVELNGAESFLVTMLDKGDTRWFPQQAAMCLQVCA